MTPTQKGTADLTEEDKKPKHRSVSQHNTFHRCAWSYKLQRIDKVWQRPASWLSQGLGVHVAMEEWEKSDRTLTTQELVRVYQEEFIRSVNEQAEETPNFDCWFGSGPYSGPVDIERRFEIGEQQLLTLVQYSLDHPDTRVWTTPDGDKALELEFEVELGGVKVKGFIDQIVERSDGELVVRDIKTGSKPGDAFQLATYSEAVRILHGVAPRYGDYFMGKTGKPTKPIPITDEDRAAVHDSFRELEELIQAGDFQPNPSRSTCTMCSVKTSCEFAVA